MESFADRLNSAVGKLRNPVLVGLDPRADRLPEGFLDPSELNSPFAVAAAYERFCCGVIDVVGSLVPAVKPQAAFFEQVGPAGMAALGKVIQYATEKGLLVIRP